MNAFNEYGVPNEAIEAKAGELQRLCNTFLDEMAQEGHSVTDIRATAEYFMGTVHLATSMSILKLQTKLRKAKPDLSVHEKTLLEGPGSGHHIRKMDAIRSYRDRTGLGLRDAKNAIENWLNRTKEN